MSDPQSFVGRRVKVTTSKHVVQGVVASLGLQDRTLSLSDVSLSTGEKLSSLEVKGPEILDLQVLLPNPEPKPKKPSSPALSGENDESAITTPKATKKKGKNGLKSRSPATQESVGTFDEYDFQANNAKFNKEAVFRQIRSDDNVPESERLVAHNKVNYKPTEMVLGNAIDRPRAASTEGLPYLSSAGGLPGAKPLQLVNIYRELLSIGFTDASIVETGGRGIAEIATRAIGRARLDPRNHNSQPLVVILAANSRSSSYALAAGHVMVGLGVTVVAVTVGELRDRCLEQAKLLQATGGKIVNTQKALYAAIEAASSPVDLVIDGLQGFEDELEDQLQDNDEVMAATWLISWANGRKCPILNVDHPSGWGTHRSEPPARSNWLVSVGYPLDLLSQEYKQSQKFVVNLAVPHKVLMKLNMQRFQRASFGGQLILAYQDAAATVA